MPPQAHQCIWRTTAFRLKASLRIGLCLALLFGQPLFSVNPLSAQQTDVWIGTGGKDGIFHLKLNVENGRLSNPTVVAEIAGTGFLAIHPDGKTLYSTAKKDGESGIAAFSFGKSESAINLKELKRELAVAKEKYGAQHPRVATLQKQIKLAQVTGGPAPKLELRNFVSTGDGGAACVGVDKTGSTVMSAQYGGGSTTSYLLSDDGSIAKRVDVIEHGAGSGVNERRQEKSHPHWVGTSPDNRFLFVPDLGKDSVVVYELEPETGKIKKHSEVPVPAGAGPRHMKFHTSGKYVYVLNELALTISVFKYSAESAGFENIQLIETLPDAMKDKHLNSAAEIRVHPTGNYVYSSNRGHDTISVFRVDPQTGKLSFVEREPVRGAFPRNFNIDPEWKMAFGGWAAFQYTDVLRDRSRKRQVDL